MQECLDMNSTGEGLSLPDEHEWGESENVRHNRIKTNHNH